MPEPEAAAAAMGWPAEGLIHGKPTWQQALQAMLSSAHGLECRELLCVDPDFADWPWSAVEVLDALTAWARPGRRLHLLAADFEPLRRAHPRFVQWRQRYDHLVRAGQFLPEEWRATAGRLEGLLLLPGHGSLRLFSRDSWRASLSRARRDELASREIFDAVAQRSSDSFGASVLGL